MSFGQSVRRLVSGVQLLRQFACATIALICMVVSLCQVCRKIVLVLHLDYFIQSDFLNMKQVMYEKNGRGVAFSIDPTKRCNCGNKNLKQ